MKRYITIFCVGLSFLLHSGCRKFVEVPPPITQVSNTSLFLNGSAVESALNGIYITMEGNSVGGGTNGLSVFLGLSADEFNLYPGSGLVLSQVYANQQQSNNPPSIWTDLYNLIYQANGMISGAANSTGIPPTIKQRAIGEAEFIRAFCDFYLVNLYGNIPLVTTTDYKSNATLGQSATAKVYAEIVADLKDAIKLLGPNYVDGQGNIANERVRPNSFAASALLARVYLFMGAYDSAELQANLVLNNPNYVLYKDSLGLDSVFLTSSREAIWQLELPATDLYNTPDGAAFLLGVLYFGGPSSDAPFTLSDSLMASFEPNDLRRSQWVDSTTNGTITYYYPYKYKLYLTNSAPGEYPTILRLAEQYLIRAEARAQKGNLLGAAADLDTVRSRAGLPPTTASTKADLLAAILRERRVELFSEYGHRWLDLKRTGIVDQVMSLYTPQVKGGNAWMPTDSLYPIPYADIQTDPRLKQNPGYN